MTTERIIDAAATMLETWAANLRESARLCDQQMQAGDPHGIGLDRLLGRMETYDDVAEALQASADDVRLRVHPAPEGPVLRAVPSPKKGKGS